MPLTIEQRLQEAGIRRLALPMASDNPAMQHVNAWRVGARAVFDTGRDNAETRAAWRQSGVDQVTDVFCTHAHSDHMGLAHHFAVSGARIHATAGEMATLRRTYERPAATADRIREAFLRAMGGWRPDAHPSRPLGGAPTTPPADVELLEEGHCFEFDGTAWRVSLGSGHSARPALFAEERYGLVVTGDQILPEMTPYIGIAFDSPEADPLGDMLAFLAAHAHLDADVVALPGHGAPFTDVGRRVRAHIASYERRLARILAAAVAPLTGAQLLSVLFRVAPGQAALDIHYAMAAALLNHLLGSGKMQRWRDEHGAWRYQRR